MDGLQGLQPEDAKTAVRYGQADAALGFLETHGPVAYTAEEERAVVRKIDWVLMPLMIVSYTIQYMDKSVMAQSAIYDLQSSLKLVGQDYSWCSSIFYFGYLAFQPLAARLLVRVPLGRFVAVTSLLWAVVLSCTAGATNFAGLMVLRFVLGACEAGISPAYVLIMGTWYKRDEIPLRITLWYCGNGLAIILQAFIAFGVGHIHAGAMPVWRWFFIIFGLIGFAWAGVLWRCMPDTPLAASFLDEREQLIAVERLRVNRTGVQANHVFKKDQFREAMTDAKVWYGFFYSIACVVPATAVANFGSLVIKGFGYGSFASSLLNVPLGVTEIIGLLVTGLVAVNVPNTRCLMQFVVNVPAIVGAVLVYTLPSSHRVGRLIAFYCTNFTNGSLPMLFALTTTNMAGHTKRATANAVLFVGYSTAFIIGPQFFIARESPRYATGFKTMIIMFSIAAVAPGFYYAYMVYLNRRKARALATGGDGANVRVENEEFMDTTDKQQPRFVYAM